MFSAIYIEEAVKNTERVRRLTARYPQVPQIEIARYGEVFNRRAQNFRLQKRFPALILAAKHDKHVLPAPQAYGIGGSNNYYFSHMLNCIYDCRYCFLQGMYRAAHYVLFVNYQDIQQAIAERIGQHGSAPSYFYSGYDCDSLALEPVSGFVENFLPLFARYPQAILELRTKSTQIRALLDHPPLPNCVVAFSFTPAAIAQALENKVPDIEKRLQAARKLQALGWPIGLRFDPIIYDERYHQQYRELFDRVFDVLDRDKLHSVSLGLFRLPRPFFETMWKLYPEEKLFAAKLEKQGDMISYQKQLETRMLRDCEELLLQYISSDIYFPCIL